MAINHGPFLQAPSETGVTISWATTRKAVSWVEYRAESSGIWLTNFPARHGLVDADATFHNTALKDLSPGTSYIYRVASREITSFKSYSVKFGSTVPSPEYRFTTLDKRKTGFSFVVANDRHENEAALRSSWRSVDWKGVDLTFLNGDMVHAIQSEPQLFRVIIDPCVEHFAKTAPLVYVRGNHDTRGSFARSLLNYFPTDSNRYYYTIRQGPVMFLVLDCGEDKQDTSEEYFGLVAFRPYMQEQVKWLEKEIESPAFRDARFRVCLLHIPPSSVRNEKFVQSRWLWENIVPLLNKGQVDLLLCGHTHRDAIQPAGTDGLNFPLIIGGAETVVQCNVGLEQISFKRTTLTGDALPQLPPIVIRNTLQQH